MRVIRVILKAFVVVAVFLATMVGLYLSGWDVGGRRLTIWVLAITTGIALLATNLLWPDLRRRVERLLLQKQDWDASQLLLRMADRGDPWAQTNLAALYFTDRGVDRNPQEALRLLEAASSKGFAPAWTALGLAYRDGTGVATDQAKALDYLRRAATKGDSAARAILRAQNSG